MFTKKFHFYGFFTIYDSSAKFVNIGHLGSVDVTLELNEIEVKHPSSFRPLTSLNLWNDLNLSWVKMFIL